MLSEALYIMDRNMERLMVEEMKEEVAEAQEKAEAARKEADSAKREACVAKEEAKIFSLYISGKSPEEIADILSTTLNRVNEVLSTANITI